MSHQKPKWIVLTIFLFIFFGDHNINTYASVLIKTQILGTNIGEVNFQIDPSSRTTVTLSGAESNDQLIPSGEKIRLQTAVMPENPKQTPPKSIYGDGKCQTDENFKTCPADCPTIPQCADLNGDGVIDIFDVVKLINYAFRGAAGPDPLWKADLDGDGIINVVDVVHIINYAFRGGPLPTCGL